MPPEPPTPSPAHQRLRRFLSERMRMSPIVWGERVKRMVGRVLNGNGITELQQGRYRLIGSEELSDSERDELLQLCRLRFDAFQAQGGEEVFAHRSRHHTPISGSIKYRVLTRALGRCECCGWAVAWQTPHQQALEVDHVIPKNQAAQRGQQPAGAAFAAMPASATRIARISAGSRRVIATGRMAAFSSRWREAGACCLRTSWRSASPP
jgi:hypothetical protein